MEQIISLLDTCKGLTGKDVALLFPKFVPPDNVDIITDMKEPVVTSDEHKADPIKDINDIIRIRDYLHERGRYRDELLFIMGINFGLRISDLLKLRIGDIITPQLEYRNPVMVQEKKTGKPRKLYINNAVNDAFGIYITSLDKIDFNDYLFEGYKGKPLTRQHVGLMLRTIGKDLNLPYHCGTHMLRKTFAYWTLMTAKDKQRALYYLQKTLNHTSSTATLFYVGITDDEIMATSMNLNLGYRDVIDVESTVVYTG